MPFSIQSGSESTDLFLIELPGRAIAHIPVQEAQKFSGQFLRLGPYRLWARPIESRLSCCVLQCSSPPFTYVRQRRDCRPQAFNFALGIDGVRFRVRMSREPLAGVGCHATRAECADEKMAGRMK